MSRSTKKPYINWCGCKPGTMKWWKKRCNRRVRKREEILCGSNFKKIQGNDTWSSPSDSKVYWDEPMSKKK